MSYSFGRFVLDAEARSLLLGGEPQNLQPLVFDFLALLVASADRVVAKDELMDALWPDVFVTESSLQRVASLARRALGAGGMADAIRNHSKHGYSFRAPAPLTDAVSEARDAARRKDWAAACALFASADASLAADDLQHWADACECLGRPADAIPILIRAVETFQHSGQTDRAARAAITVARIEADRGAGALAQGWIERAAALVSTRQDPAAEAYLAWIRARFAALGGEANEALRLASEAVALADRSGDLGLRALTLAFKGFYHLSLGDTAEGQRLQNHAAALTLSGSVDPVTGALVYCNILWGCRTHADWERASQWSDGFEAWCAASFAQSSGACDLHRAELLGARGSLPDALRKIESALPKLTRERAIALGEAHRIRGDLLAMIGDGDGAARDYATAYALGWDAEPGSAILLHESGNSDGALAALDQVLAGQSWFHLQRTGLLLAHAARIAAQSGKIDRARHYLDRFALGNDRWNQPAVLALVAEAEAALAPSEPRAIRRLTDARRLWDDAALDYQAARVRLELAASHLLLGQRYEAEAELAIAERTATRIESARLIDACSQMRVRVAEPRRRDAKELLSA